ncbi:hypothetical protein A4S06_02250 [Erysipelotrichaceae bacterium MTC7]|nr:hypothetical protein A4S06_02250 [Erysipelotrichaceae bacterium MTC7]
MIETKQIVIDGYKITYQLEKKKMKNMVMRIQEDGSLKVSANPYIPQHKIDSFLQERLSWILAKQEKQHAIFDRIFTTIEKNRDLYLFDEAYTIICVQSNKKGIQFLDKNVYVYYVNDKAECDTQLHKWIRQECEKRFTSVIHEFDHMLQDYRISFPTLKVRKMKSRWGSCATRSNLITLNTNLLHLPKSFCEYVVLHELAHFVQPNHSKHFYQIIENYMPDYKVRTKLINQL